ncbi:hypothetical protein AGIG_G12913 [Arapaima gigas]
MAVGEAHRQDYNSIDPAGDENPHLAHADGEGTSCGVSSTESPGAKVILHHVHCKSVRRKVSKEGMCPPPVLLNS